MKKLYEWICRMELIVVKYILLVLAFLVFAAAVARTVRHPMNWAIDVATFFFAWCVFLGGDIAVREDRLFCIVLITSKLSPKAQLILKAVNYAIIGLFLIGMIVYGSILSYSTRMRTFQGIPGFSYTWVTLSIPIGCSLMLATSILKIKNYIKAMRGGAEGKAEAGVTEII